MRSTLLYVFIALILVTLGACLHPVADMSEVIVEPDRVPIIAPPGQTPDERNIDARDLLQVGKEDEARVQLEASLAELPASNNPLAQKLLAQITGDPVKMLGSKYFNYEIAKGESLSLIAKEYLGDPLKFYVLARYNDLENPSLVNTGDVIKVPGKKPDDVVINPPPVEPTDTAKREPEPPVEPMDTAKKDPEPPVEPTDTAEKVPEPPVEPTDTAEKTTPEPTPPDGELVDLLAEAGDMVDAGNYGGAIIHLEKGLARFPDTKMIMDFLAGVYVKLGGKLGAEGEYGEAQSALQQASILDPDNKEISGRLAEADRAARADDLFLEGLKYYKKDAKIDAYESYKAALKVWSSHEPAQIEKAKITPEVAGIYYREGKIAFQRRDLKGALAMYDKTLEVNPGHEPAKLNRQQTIDLLESLKGHSTAGEQDGT